MMRKENFKDGTIRNFTRAANRLIQLAQQSNTMYYSDELELQFINDSNYIRLGNHYKGELCLNRLKLHRRFIAFIRMFVETGHVDWAQQSSRVQPGAELNEYYQRLLNSFRQELKEDELSKNTIDGYIRFVRYFLKYLEEKNYKSTKEIKSGDVTDFLLAMTSSKYSATSLGAHIPGLKRFLCGRSSLRKYAYEIPERLQKRKSLVEIYTDEENHRIRDVLENDCSISARDRAIGYLAFELGLRAVDICNLQLNNIQWKNHQICLVQKKTDFQITFPLRSTYGQAMADYILNDRPDSDSECIFLSSILPYKPLTAHSGIRIILGKILGKAKVDSAERIIGTRMMRHNSASVLVRKGSSLTEVAAVTGHKNLNSVMIYVTTDPQGMKECILPLPLPLKDGWKI